jgi:hypothetical protein
LQDLLALTLLQTSVLITYLQAAAEAEDRMLAAAEAQEDLLLEVHQYLDLIVYLLALEVLEEPLAEELPLMVEPLLLFLYQRLAAEAAETILVEMVQVEVLAAAALDIHHLVHLHQEHRVKDLLVEHEVAYRQQPLLLAQAAEAQAE